MPTKYQAIMKVSKEFMPLLLGIPDGIEVTSINFDHKRGTYDIVIQSNTYKEELYPVAEAQEIPQNTIILDKHHEDMKKFKEFKELNRLFKEKEGGI